MYGLPTLAPATAMPCRGRLGRIAVTTSPSKDGDTTDPDSAPEHSYALVVHSLLRTMHIQLSIMVHSSTLSPVLSSLCCLYIFLLLIECILFQQCRLASKPATFLRVGWVHSSPGLVPSPCIGSSDIAWTPTFCVQFGDGPIF